MDPIGSTKSAEQRFQQILEVFFKSQYDEKTLPSHGLYHHRRVWAYIKELLNTGLFYVNVKIPAEKLIIATYLHDIGMSVEKGPSHGRHSRDLCLKFLTMNRLDPENYTDVMEAIENHDRKDYPENGKAGELLTILSLADDMDAFGFTGIYRYVEIYVTRNIKPGNIGHRIKENASKRFNNFEAVMGIHKEFLHKHKERYKTLDTFFNNYNEQVPSYKFGYSDLHGHCGVIELIMRSLNEFFALKNINVSYLYPEDPVIKWFLEGLKKEML